MKNGLQSAQINLANVPADGNVGGLLFTAGTVMIFFWGIPLIRYLVPTAILLGGGLALVFRKIRHDASGNERILKLN